MKPFTEHAKTMEHGWNDDRGVIDEMRARVGGCYSDTDLRALGFMTDNPRTRKAWHGQCFFDEAQGRATAWRAWAGPGAGPVLCDSYRFADLGHGLRLDEIYVIRDPATVGGWIGAVAELVDPLAGGKRKQATLPWALCRAVGLPKGAQVSYIHLTDDAPGLNGGRIEGDEVLDWIQGYPNLKWSSTQQSLLDMGPPTTVFEIVNCEPWKRRVFGPIWQDFRLVRRACKQRPGVLKDDDVRPWLLSYLAELERMVVGFAPASTLRSFHSFRAMLT